MDDPLGRFDANEIERLKARFQELVAASIVVPRPIDELPFEKIALEESFRAKDAVKILLDKSPTYYGQKECLFGAFCAWVIEPSAYEIREHLVRHTAIGIVDQSEIIAEMLTGKLETFADFFAKNFICGQQFLNEIYYVVGARSAYSDLASRDFIGISISADSKTINSTIRMMDYFHYIVLNHDDNRHFNPSLNKGLEAIVKVKHHLRDNKGKEEVSGFPETIVSRTVIYDSWTRRKETVALIYAASKIKSGKSTLLDRLMSAEAYFPKEFSKFEKWLGMARYFCDVVLSRLQDSEVYTKNVSALSLVKPVKIPPARLNPFEIDILKKKFRKTF